MPYMERDDFWIHVIKLLRPAEWTKTLLNMVIGSIGALYVLYGMEWSQHVDLGLFAYAFIAIGPLLWGGLYALNDWTDWKKDKLHPVKKNRAIPSGKVHPNFAVILVKVVLILAFLIGLHVSLLFFVCMIAMLLNQLMYTLKPFRLKERAFLDLVSGSMINPFFRFYAGWVLFLPAFNAPLWLILMVVGGQFGGYVIYRLAGKHHEKGLNYNSSVVVLGSHAIRVLAYAAMVLALLAFAYGVLFAPQQERWPLQLLWLVPLNLVFLPGYWSALRNPQKMDLPNVYRLLYWNVLVLALAFIALFLL
ncbi:MAG: UbiA family prenyltransferase [Candidatus Diapherotrites archaeon]|nr:UbiA family prenyltransferase [Candidatus Diapherotrites archaeon]